MCHYMFFIVYLKERRCFSLANEAAGLQICCLHVRGMTVKSVTRTSTRSRYPYVRAGTVLVFVLYRELHTTSTADQSTTRFPMLCYEYPSFSCTMCITLPVPGTRASRVLTVDWMPLPIKGPGLKKHATASRHHRAGGVE
eukprot:scaffold267161_cov16-Prasinocladus_malaysianus.AAC.1